MKRRKRKKRGRVNLRKIRVTTTYSLAEIAKLFGVHTETVRSWKRQGLPILPDTRPVLVHGLELKRWLEARQKARKRPCAPDQFFCLSCRLPQRPAKGSVWIKKSNQRVGQVEAECENCGTKLHKGFAMSDLAEIEKTFATYKGNIEDLYGSNNSPLNIV